MCYVNILKILITTFIITCTAAIAENHGGGVGFRFLQLHDPLNGQLMRAALFYPADQSEGMTSVGPFKLDGEENARPRAGKFPLVVFSHGHAGTRLGHHSSATYLARHGINVLALEHPRDNFLDTSGAGTDLVWIGRIRQVSAALDQLLNDDGLRQMVDTRGIGIAGFSAGGYTALAVVGATPKLALLADYCQREKSSLLCAGGGAVRQSDPPLYPVPDARFRAAFVMSPVGAFFDSESLSHVRVPVSIVYAGKDEVLPPNENALKMQQGLPASTSFKEIPEAGHYVFLSPYSEQMKDITPELCEDRPEVERKAIELFSEDSF